METIIGVFFIIISTAVLSLSSVKILTILQQCGYKAGGVLSWLSQSKYSCLVRYVAFGSLATALMLLFNFCFPGGNAHYFSMLIYALFAVLFIFLMFRPRAKVPQRFTPRMIRLYVTNTLLCGGVSVGAFFLAEYTPIRESAFGLLPIFIIGIALLAAYINLPLEKLIARGFIKSAAKEIEKRKTGKFTVIGITGSYGKTTAKNILAKMLADKYCVCGGEGSYNTPLGLCRVINEKLRPADEILIVEMGARRLNDIKELCEIAKPDIGIITSVGNQHLESFGTKQNILDGKYELIEGISGDFAAFNGDDNGAKKLFDRCELLQKMLTGSGDGKAVGYKNVRFGRFGCRFTLTSGENAVEVETKLLGEYIPSLIALCSSVALKFDVSLEACAAACSTLQPVPHRLELMQNGNSYIIDDAYNANIKGALCALKVLGSFDCTRIIVTPGLVELGSDEKEANMAFGKQIAEFADIAILVGSRGVLMKTGALEGGMDGSKIFCVKSLDQATGQLKNINGERVVLFENDLTDSYC